MRNGPTAQVLFFCDSGLGWSSEASEQLEKTAKVQEDVFFFLIINICIYIYSFFESLSFIFS